MPNLPIHMTKRVPLQTISNSSSSGTSPNKYTSKPPQNPLSQAQNLRLMEPRKSSLRRQSAVEPLTNNAEVKARRGRGSVSNKRVSFGGENINFIYKHSDVPSPEAEPPSKIYKKSAHASPNQQFSSGPRMWPSPVPPNRSFQFASLDDSDEEEEGNDGAIENNEMLPATSSPGRAMLPVEKLSPLAPHNDFTDTRELRHSFGLFRDEDAMPEVHTDETEGNPGDATLNLTGWDISSRRRSSVGSSVANDGDVTQNMLSFNKLLDLDENDDVQRPQRTLSNDNSDQAADKVQGSEEGKYFSMAADNRDDISLPDMAKRVHSEDDRLGKSHQEDHFPQEFSFQQENSNEEDVEDSCITLPAFGNHSFKEIKQPENTQALDSGQIRRFSDESNISPNLKSLVEMDEADDLARALNENVKDDVTADQDYSNTPRKLFEALPEEEDDTLHWPGKYTEKEAQENPTTLKGDDYAVRPNRPPMEMRNMSDIIDSDAGLPSGSKDHDATSPQNTTPRIDKHRVSLSPTPVAHEIASFRENEFRREKNSPLVNNAESDEKPDDECVSHNKQEVQNLNTKEPASAAATVNFEPFESEKNRIGDENLAENVNDNSVASPDSPLINDKAFVRDGSEHILETESGAKPDSRKAIRRDDTSASSLSHSNLPGASAPEKQVSQSSHSLESDPSQSTTRHLSRQESASQTLAECPTKPCTFSNFLQGLRTFGISLDLPSISGRDSFMPPPEPGFHRFDRSTMEGQILDGARKRTVLSVLNEQIKSLRAMVKQEHEVLKQVETQLEIKQPSVFKKICNVELLDARERTAYGLNLKRLRKVCTLQAKIRWVESRKVWEQDILNHLRSMETGLGADKKALQRSCSSLEAIAQRVGAPLTTDENDNAGFDENAIIARRTVVHELSSLRDLHRYVTSQAEEERELQSTNAELKARKEELIRQLEPLERFAEADNEAKLHKLLSEQRELNTIVSGVSGITLTHVSPQRIAVRVASCMEVQLSIHTEKVINVSCKAVHVGPTRPAYWKGYIDAIVGVAISISQLRSIKLLRDVTPSLFAASEFLLRARFAVEEAEAYCLGNVAEITKAGLYTDVFDASSGNGGAVQVEIQASFFSVKKRCKFDLRVAHIVSVEYGDVRSVNQAIELYEVDHIIGDYPSGDTIREVVMKGSQTQGNMLSLQSGLNRLWAWIDNEDGK